MRIDNNLHEKSIKILTDLISFKTISGSDNSELIDYCELPFEKQCLQFYNSSRPVKTPSAEQVRQPIYKSALNYWKNFEEDLSILSNHFNE